MAQAPDGAHGSFGGSRAGFTRGCDAQRRWLRLCRGLVGVFSLCAVLCANAGSTPAFWRVQSPTATLYLLGSMHFGTQAFYPLPGEIESAFERADTLVVEVDITRVSPSQAVDAIALHGRLADGKTLTEVLQADTLSALKTQAAQNGIPFTALQRFKPWFAALQVVEAEIRKTGFTQEYGVDQYFLKQAADKQIIQLETLDAQLGIFSSLSLAEQEAFLVQTLDDLGDSRRYLESLAQAWQQGDTERLQVTLIEPFKEDPAAAQLYRTLFAERNDRMTAKATQLLKTAGSSFLVVGAGHLIGDTGIVAQLRKMGFECERVSLAKPAAP